MKVDPIPCATNWPIRRLGEVSSITLGGTPSTSVPSFWGGEIKWMSSGEVNLRRVWDVEGRITLKGLAGSNATLVDPPAVAIGLAGQGKTRGTAALVNVRLCSNQSIALIKGAVEDLDTGFLFHNLDARYEELRARSSGGGRGGLSRNILAAVPISLPPLPEQRRIAEILDTLDETIRKTEQVIAKLQQMKQGLLHDLLTRGIDENGELRDPERNPGQFKDSPLGMLPQTWETHHLAEVAEIRSGIAKNSRRPVSNPVYVHYLRVANVQDGFLDLTEMSKIKLSREEIERYEVWPGDVLMNEGGDLDKLGRGSVWCGQYTPCVHQNHVFVVRCGPKLRPEFLNSWSGSEVARRFFMVAGKQTTNLASINKSALGLLPVAIPQLDEQEAIIKALVQVDLRIESELNGSQKLRVLKQGLMDDLLTGKVRVTAPEEPTS